MSFRRTLLALAVASCTASTLALGASTAGAASKATVARFDLFANQRFLNCASADPSNPATAKVRVVRGRDNDTLDVRLRGFKPGLQFDLFTVERSPQRADGTADPAFGGNFGMAWYQSDLHVDHDGDGRATIRTILLDQVFGFDAGVGLAPTNTFHVGFWFNDPADAAACGFTGSTPFNGDHRAGPLAFVSRPNATTALGPLCVSPTSGSSTPRCDP